MTRFNHYSLIVVLAALAMLAQPVHGQKGPETTLTKLPQDHDYQRVLRTYMATLTEKDFDHGVTEKIPTDTPTSTDPEYLYRQYILTLWHQPLVGSKRGTPAISAPPGLFVLPAFETSRGIMQLPVWPETLMSFTQWDYPGNHYRNSRALKLRTFVAGATWMMMLHNFAELNDSKTPPPVRPDWHGYNPVFFAAPYPGFKDVLPPEVQKAYETGMKMVGERMLGWGIRGESCETDLMAPMGLVYISRAANDPEFSKAVEDRVRLICTDSKYFNSAGFWVERGGIDTGFGGQANLYAAWIGLMTDWPFVRKAVEKTYRLRGHLLFPEPDGKLTGPSHFNSRLGSPANSDQFDLKDGGLGSDDGARDVAVSLLTDEAAQFVLTPNPETLKAAPGHRANYFNFQIGENPRITENGKQRHIRDEEIKNEYPWKVRMWMTYNFPVSVNPGYEFYRKGAFAHRQELVKKNSPLLKSPYLRGESFVRDFDKAFVAVRQPGFAAALHTGPVGSQSADDHKAQFGGPMGLGGGQLSAFWTPESGAVILGLRKGMSYDKSFDVLDDWRTWPIHAVSGVSTGGTVFTSARNAAPQVACDVTDGGGRITVEGPLVAMKIFKDPGAPDAAKAKDLMYDEPLAGSNGYVRTFVVDGKGVGVETTISGDGQETVAELCETIPVYLGTGAAQVSNANARIEFQTGGKWASASDQYTEKVQAVRLTRFGGSVRITFDKPRRAKLSPAEWTDSWLNVGAASRNVMIDLLETGGKPALLKETRRIAYRIEPCN